MRKVIKLAIVFTAGYQVRKHESAVADFIVKRAGDKIANWIEKTLYGKLPNREPRAYRKYNVVPDADAS